MGQRQVKGVSGVQLWCVHMSFRYFLSPAGRFSSGGEAGIPLPYPGEGGPVYPGDDMIVEPVIPLPYPGEGGPVYPGDDIIVEPVIPLPYPGEGGPVYPGEDNIPVIPLPYPGEGGPVYPGNNNCPGGGCNRPGSARVRFLNAAFNYPPLRISVSNSRFVNRLGYAAVTNYGRVRAGYQTVTVSNPSGRIYIQKSMPFQADGLSTIAVIKTSGGLDLLQIADRCCPPSNGSSSFRVGNLAYNSSPMDVIMSDGRVIYGDLRYKEVSAFRRILPGTYQFFYANTSLTPMPSGLEIEPLDPAWLGVYPPQETFGSLTLSVSGGEVITVYLLQNGTGRNNIQNMILID